MIKEDQKIKAVWSKCNKRHYVARGYKFTNYGDEITIDISDLSAGSHASVTVVCDYCGQEYQAVYKNLIKGRRSISKDSCRLCVGQKCAEVTLLKRREQLYANVLSVCNSKNFTLLTSKDSIMNNATYIDYKCNIHGVHRMKIANLLSGKGCPECAADLARSRYRLSSQEVASNISLYGGVLLNPDDYVNNQYKNLNIQCSECGELFVTSYRSFVQHGGQICPSCAKTSESLGERKIRKYLDDHGVSYIQEHWFADCRDVNPLPFDFYLPDQNTIIEFDGRQHFSETRYFTYSFEKVKSHDAIKNLYCQNHRINLIRIPYWKINSIEEILDNDISQLT